MRCGSTFRSTSTTASTRDNKYTSLLHWWSDACSNEPTALFFNKQSFTSEYGVLNPWRKPMSLQSSSVAASHYYAKSIVYSSSRPFSTWAKLLWNKVFLFLTLSMCSFAAIHLASFACMIFKYIMDLLPQQCQGLPYCDTSDCFSLVSCSVHW